MRLTTVLALALAPALLGGCGGSGGTPDPAASGTPGPVSGAGWVVVATGSPTPSPRVSYSGSAKPALPPVSFLPVDPSCEQTWEINGVLIPLTVTAGAGSLTVSWPRQYASNYRITAVPQPLVSGGQPAYTWQDVPAGAGCTVTATITGLKAGTPYVVWLDAPNTGYERDGTRHPYSGRSGVVYPT